MPFTFMFSRPVKQAFICFRRNLFKLWQSKSTIVSFLSSSHLESSLDHAWRWCGGEEKKGPPRSEMPPTIKRSKRIPFHALPSTATVSMQHFTQEQQNREAIAHPAAGPALALLWALFYPPYPDRCSGCGLWSHLLQGLIQISGPTVPPATDICSISSVFWVSLPLSCAFHRTLVCSALAPAAHWSSAPLQPPTFSTV